MIAEGYENAKCDLSLKESALEAINFSTSDAIVSCTYTKNQIIKVDLSQAEPIIYIH